MKILKPLNPKPCNDRIQENSNRNWRKLRKVSIMKKKRELNNYCGIVRTEGTWVD